MTVVHVHCVHLTVYNHVDVHVMRLNFHQTHFTCKTSASQQPERAHGAEVYPSSQ